VIDVEEKRVEVNVIPWPNTKEVVDGVVPTDEVSQDPALFLDDNDGFAEMEE